MKEGTAEKGVALMTEWIAKFDAGLEDIDSHALHCVVSRMDGVIWNMKQ